MVTFHLLVKLVFAETGPELSKKRIGVEADAIAASGEYQQAQRHLVASSEASAVVERLRQSAGPEARKLALDLLPGESCDGNT
ncbi:hypothetical protein C5167_006307 [Papaver somniferum]|uniref:Uncharacterized protein n=1 Tax=Papaver somniferum TaxID=3469 RepID=A0A4Y7JD25_PAPSO|nr:hypothetical protein C5167_006307 [Papaver somniferum]